MASSSHSDERFIDASGRPQSNRSDVDMNDSDMPWVPSLENSTVRYRLQHMAWGLWAKSSDWGHLCELDKAARIVQKYSPKVKEAKPDPVADPGSQSLPYTTVVSAFFPPPTEETLVRQKDTGTVTRSIDEYLDGVHQLIVSAQHLVIFLPPDLAVQVRNSIPPLAHVLIYDHYNTVWDIPHLKGKREEFYTRQVDLACPGGNRDGVYGHPHSWAAWNAKAYLVLEAIGLNPFETSHFAWLDIRTPPVALESFPYLKNTQGIWPTTSAVAALYAAGPGNTPARAIVTALDRGLCEPGTPYWPRDFETGERVDAALQDIWSVSANIMIGTKFAMARLSRAQLLLMERDLARGVFIGREEYQMSYLHFEFEPIMSVLEVFKRRPFKEPMRPWIYAYVQLAKDSEADWSGMGFDHIKANEDESEGEDGDEEGPDRDQE